MKQHYFRFLVLLSLFTSFSVFSQLSSKERDYTITYSGASISLLFDVPVYVAATNVQDGRSVEVAVAADVPNLYVISNADAGAIIKLDYTYLYGNNYAVQTSYVATPSLSTGTIAVYFNHPVNTAFSQGQNAVNLGNTLDDKLITYIDACTTTLDIAIYNSASPSATTGIAGAINAAYARGVQVRVIYDGSTTSSMIPLLNSAIPRLASPNNSNYGIMHNKFVIFDAAVLDANKPVVWTGSTNWTVSQIDGPDKNSCIVIQDQTMALGYRMEFEEMWGSSTMVPNTTFSKFGPYKTDNTPHTYTVGGKIVNSYFSPSDVVTSKIIDVINTADSDIDVATMLVTRSDISAALIDKYNSGLSLTNMVLDTQNPSGNQKTILQTALGTDKVRTDTSSGVMHHKFMVVDNFNSASDPLVLVGSHNWSSAAETKNDENTLIVHDLTVANQYYQAFAYLFQLSGGVLGAEQFERTSLVVYPNPSSGVFTIESSGGALSNVEVVVHTVLGTTVFDKTYSVLDSEFVDLSTQAAGVYFVSVVGAGGTSYFKVVKE